MLNMFWDFKVRFGETDAAGIVFYPNFYQWMDQATQEMLEATAYAPKQTLASGQGTPLVEAHCQFRKPLYFGDHVKVVSAVTEVKNKVFTIGHSFYRGDDLIAEGYEVRAWVEFSEGRVKAEPIPDSLRELLGSSHHSTHI